MKAGWIKVYRTLLEHPRKQNPFWVALWMHLLLSADHSGGLRRLFKGQEIVLKPGQLLTSRKSLSEGTGLSEWQVERLLTGMENAQEIAQETDFRSRLLTITNWSKYQDSAQEIARVTHKSRTSPAHTQEFKNRETKEVRAANAVVFSFPAGLENSQFKAVWSEWVDYRSGFKKIKGDPGKFFNRQLARCAELGSDVAVAKLRKAMLNQWQGFDFDSSPAPTRQSTPVTFTTPVLEPEQPAPTVAVSLKGLFAESQP